MKKLLSVILALVIAAAPVAVCAAQTVPHYSNECVSHCGGDCEYSPLIVVPGIMQSQVYVQDENGNDLLTKKFNPTLQKDRIRASFYRLNAILIDLFSQNNGRRCSVSAILKRSL